MSVLRYFLCERIEHDVSISKAYTTLADAYEEMKKRFEHTVNGRSCQNFINFTDAYVITNRGEIDWHIEPMIISLNANEIASLQA